MSTPNAVLMERARESLKGRWGLAIGFYFVYFGVTILISLLFGHIKGFGPIIPLILAGPFLLGSSIFALLFSRDQDVGLEYLFKGFNHFGRAVGAYLWMLLFIILWSLLLIVPGIIASLAYAQTFFLIADDSSLGFREAIKKSKKIMYGNKWKYFCLQWRFVGWFLLSLLTLGIGLLWLIPYVRISNAKFYEDLKSSTPV